MSQRQKKLALSLLISCSCAMAAFFALSAWYVGGSIESEAQAQEAEPTPLPVLIGSVLPPEPPINVEAARAAFESADGLGAKLQALKSSGVEMWRPEGGGASSGEPVAAPELAPEEEEAIDALVEGMPPVKAKIASNILRRGLTAN